MARERERDDPKERAKRQLIYGILGRVGCGDADTITYGELAGQVTAMTLIPNGRPLAMLLDEIATDLRKDANNYLVTAVVVTRASRTSGEGLYKLAKRLNYEFNDRYAFYAQQHKGALEYWRARAASDLPS